MRAVTSYHLSAQLLAVCQQFLRSIKSLTVKSWETHTHRMRNKIVHMMQNPSGCYGPNGMLLVDADAVPKLQIPMRNRRNRRRQSQPPVVRTLSSVRNLNKTDRRRQAQLLVEGKSPQDNDVSASVFSSNVSLMDVIAVPSRQMVSTVFDLRVCRVEKGFFGSLGWLERRLVSALSWADAGNHDPLAFAKPMLCCGYSSVHVAERILEAFSRLPTVTVRSDGVVDLLSNSSCFVSMGIYTATMPGMDVRILPLAKPEPLARRMGPARALVLLSAVHDFYRSACIRCAILRHMPPQLSYSDYARKAEKLAPIPPVPVHVFDPLGAGLVEIGRVNPRGLKFRAIRAMGISSPPNLLCTNLVNRIRQLLRRKHLRGLTTTRSLSLHSACWRTVEADLVLIGREKLCGAQGTRFSGVQAAYETEGMVHLSLEQDTYVPASQVCSVVAARSLCLLLRFRGRERLECLRRSVLPALDSAAIEHRRAGPNTDHPGLALRLLASRLPQHALTGCFPQKRHKIEDTWSAACSVPEGRAPAAWSQGRWPIGLRLCGLSGVHPRNCEPLMFLLEVTQAPYAVSRRSDPRLSLLPDSRTALEQMLYPTNDTIRTPARMAAAIGQHLASPLLTRDKFEAARFLIMLATADHVEAGLVEYCMYENGTATRMAGPSDHFMEARGFGLALGRGLRQAIGAEKPEAAQFFLSWLTTVWLRLLCQDLDAHQPAVIWATVQLHNEGAAVRLRVELLPGILSRWDKSMVRRRLAFGWAVAVHWFMRVDPHEANRPLVEAHTLCDLMRLHGSSGLEVRFGSVRAYRGDRLVQVITAWDDNKFAVRDLAEKTETKFVDAEDLLPVSSVCGRMFHMHFMPCMGLNAKRSRVVHICPSIV